MINLTPAECRDALRQERLVAILRGPDPRAVAHLSLIHI